MACCVLQSTFTQRDYFSILCRKTDAEKLLETNRQKKSNPTKLCACILWLSEKKKKKQEKAQQLYYESKIRMLKQRIKE